MVYCGAGGQVEEAEESPEFPPSYRLRVKFLLEREGLFVFYWCAFSDALHVI